jgi:hypothetical protein
MKKLISIRRIAVIGLFVFVASPLVASHRPGHFENGGGSAFKDLITSVVSFLGF